LVQASPRLSGPASLRGARGGIYIAGGIVPKLGPIFAQSEFRARFESKGRPRGYLAAIPTYVIVRPYPGLLGAAALRRCGASAKGQRRLLLRHILQDRDHAVDHVIDRRRGRELDFLIRIFLPIFPGMFAITEDLVGPVFLGDAPR
jgi:hypothetical protein